MRISMFFAALAAGAMTALPTAAQDLTDEDLTRAGEAANVMVGRVYVQEPVTGISPADVVARLRELGYTDINDFDVEWDEYEVEATSPNGEEVEIEIDPVTGRIMDIEENFF